MLIKQCRRWRIGHYMVEGVLVFPLFFLMSLAFVDLARWSIQKIYLWNIGQQLIRHISHSTPQSSQQWELWAHEQLLQHQQQADVQVQFIPVSIKSIPHAFRKQNAPLITKLTIRKQLSAKFPLLQFIFKENPIKMEVHLYDVKDNS